MNPAAPIAIWDTRDPDGPYARNRSSGASQWSAEHIPRANDTYRVEFYEDGRALLFRYARNEQGKYAKDDSGEPATEPPETVMLSSLPPRHLLGLES